MASSLGQRMSREDFKKAKELEELRKTGAAPPELDEEGNMINPHIPQYVSKRPWYLTPRDAGPVKPGLKHQYNKHWGKKSEFVTTGDLAWYDRTKKGKRNTKFKKGACKNCGATTHKEKDCLERPRKKGAKFTGQIARDDVIQAAPTATYDGKRDRYNGYNPAAYKKVIDHFQKADELRRKKKEEEVEERMRMKAERKAERLRERIKRRELRQKKRAEKAKAKAEGGAKNSDDSDSDSYSDSDSDTDDSEAGIDDELKDDGAVIQKHDSATRTSVRNLRIREDTAKYLMNLDVNSAHYDPKTRSMRANPHPDKDPSELNYKGDNAIRKSGEYLKVQRLQSFAWEAADRGNEDITLQANPSQAEHMYAEFKKKKEKLKEEKQRSVLSKYGGEQHLKAPPKQLLLAQSESYVEYAEDGTVIKGQEEAIPKTKYVEDVYDNNHTAVWGSFWKEGKWGYACCHQDVRNSYCTGAKGKSARAQITDEMKRREEQRKRAMVKEEAVPALKQQASTELSGINFAAPAPTGSDAGRKNKKRKNSSSSDSDSDERARQRAERKRKKREAKNRAARGLTGDEEPTLAGIGGRNKRGYNAHHDTSAPTEEEMEAWRQTQRRSDDPMANYVDKEDS